MGEKVFGKLLSLACPIIYTGSCNMCIYGTIPSRFVSEIGKQDSGWDLIVASGWLKATNHLVYLSSHLNHCRLSELLFFPWVPGLPVLDC